MLSDIIDPETQANDLQNNQQPEGPTGQVNNQAQTVNNIVGEAVAQPSAEEQTKEQLRQIAVGRTAGRRCPSTGKISCHQGQAKSR